MFSRPKNANQQFSNRTENAQRIKKDLKYLQNDESEQKANLWYCR